MWGANPKIAINNETVIKKYYIKSEELNIERLGVNSELEHKLRHCVQVKN